MTTPSLYQTIGLSISVSQPLVVGNAFLFTLTNQYTSYSHEIMANGGYWTANLVLNLSLLDAEDWYENGLGRDITVYDMAGTVVWQGFVNQITLNAGALSEIRGPLLSIGNRVSAVYTPLDVSVYPPVSGTTTVTTIAEDTDSQAMYGIIEQVVSAGTTPQDNAEQVRDVYLEENKLPETSGQLSLNPGSGQNAAVTLELLGYIHWLEVYIYNSTGTGFDVISDKIIDILAADPNGIISTNYNEIEDNAFLTPVVEDRNRFAWDILTELIALGNDTDDTRRLFGVYADRIVKYNTQPQTIEYHHRLTDPAQRVTTPQGAIVYPWNVLPGKWLFVPDFLVGRPAETSDVSLDPRNKFIESVSYSAPFSISLSGSKSDSLPQILAKITYTGGFF
jgi:hypothetical protein